MNRKSQTRLRHGRRGARAISFFISSAEIETKVAISQCTCRDQPWVHPSLFWTGHTQERYLNNSPLLKLCRLGAGRTFPARIPTDHSFQEILLYYSLPPQQSHPMKAQDVRVPCRLNLIAYQIFPQHFSLWIPLCFHQLHHLVDAGFISPTPIRSAPHSCQVLSANR